jgi:hypothetical protein
MKQSGTGVYATNVTSPDKRCYYSRYVSVPDISRRQKDLRAFYPELLTPKQDICFDFHFGKRLFWKHSKSAFPFMQTRHLEPVHSQNLVLHRRNAVLTSPAEH